MPRISLLIIFIVSIFYSALVLAEQQHQSKYAGQEKRSIKSLSNNDIEQLKNGKGWGLAKAAELNGMPGPSHLLQMKNEISLSKQQEEKIRLLFDEMKSKAIPLGNELIELEKKLNNSFAKRTITDEELSRQLDAIAAVRKKLRYVHLHTHLLTPAILTEQQIQKYNQLRGYGAGDPCKNPPQGHDVKMWKEHNDCT
jgi:Spy/CpxP family protein refolding chaperone